MFPLASSIAINDSSTVMASVIRSHRLLFGPVWRSHSSCRVSRLRQRCEGRRPPDRLQPTRHVRASFPIVSEEPGSAPRRHIGLTCGYKSFVIKSVPWQGEWGWKASTCQWLPRAFEMEVVAFSSPLPVSSLWTILLYEMSQRENFRKLMEPRYNLDAISQVHFTAKAWLFYWWKCAKLLQIGRCPCKSSTLL